MYYRRYDTTHLAVPQQLHNTPLIWRETNDLPNDRVHKLVAGRRGALAVARLLDLLKRGRGVALCETNTGV